MFLLLDLVSLQRHSCFQIDLWQKYISWEKSNPLKVEDPLLIAKRVMFAFEQCLLCLGHHPNVWYEAALFLQESSRILAEKGVRYLRRESNFLVLQTFSYLMFLNNIPGQDIRKNILMTIISFAFSGCGFVQNVSGASLIFVRTLYIRNSQHMHALTFCLRRF